MISPRTRESGDDSRPFTMEHRWGQRASCQLRVRLLASVGVDAAGRLRDVSMSGAFVETALYLPPFTRLELVVLRDAATTGTEIRTRAIVVRWQRDGVGIEWCETAAGSICALLGCTTPCAVAKHAVRSAHELRDTRDAQVASLMAARTCASCSGEKSA